MANKKFSEFTQRTGTINTNDFFVGYNGSDNIRYPSSLLTTRLNVEHYTFDHSSNNASNNYAIPISQVTEGNSQYTNQFWHYQVVPFDGYIDKIIIKSLTTHDDCTATQTRFLITKNGTLQHTTGFNNHGASSGASATFDLSSSDTSFLAGDVILIQFNTNGLWHHTNVAVAFYYET